MATQSNHSRGPGLPAHRGPTRGRLGSIRARATQGCVATAMGNVELPKSPQDICRVEQTRPTPACTAASSKDLSSNMTGVPNHLKDSADRGIKGGAEES
jgi:hypothetical protein